MQAEIEIPNFELDREIGRGGMSRVYLGKQLQPRRPVAIKIVAPGAAGDESFLQSLKQEGDTIAQMSHDNIVTVYACGVTEGHYYIAMEILSGGDLTKKIAHGMQPNDALRVLIQVGSALAHAHKKGVLHRDIKPENIMFHESGKAVLVDFGIAKESETESSFTKAGAVVGTPHYMAPERVTGKPFDDRSDLYALGVVFYEMLTGKKLYSGADTFAISYAHVYEPIPPLPDEHARFQGLLNKLVAKDPADRFQSADHLIEAIRAAAGGQVSVSGSTIAMSPTAFVNEVGAPTREVGTRPVGPQGSSTRATQAVDQVATRANAASAATPADATPSARKLPWLPIAGGAAALIAVAVVTALAMRPAKPELPTAIEDIAKRTQMGQLLQAAESNSRMQRFAEAEDIWLRVLTEFDCKNAEARRGIEAVAPDKLEDIKARCGG